MQSEKTRYSSIYLPASKEVLDEIRKKNCQKKVTFLLPTKYVSEEATVVGMLLDDIYNRFRNKREIFRTFFASCHWEAVSGAVKLIRHNYYMKKSKNPPKVLILRPQKDLMPFLESFSLANLITNVEYVFSTDEAIHLLKTQKEIGGFIFVMTSKDEFSEANDLFRICSENQVISVLDESGLQNWFETKKEGVFDFPPEMYIAGENLTDYQVPFASFTATSKVYKPWHNTAECLAHSSTYSGNTLSLSVVYENIKKHGMTGIEVSALKGRSKKYHFYARHVNPVIAWIFYSTWLSPEITEAYRSRLTIINPKNKKEEILDGIAGSGCCLRGHNPTDLIENVINKHSPQEDYWSSLKKELMNLSGFKHIFPTVSGSTAVDISVILGLVAQNQSSKKKILTFVDNYSGKSLISLNLSRYEHFLKPFEPLYSDVIEIDPFAPNATQLLEKHLLSGEVAIVWFELIQGQKLDQLPEKIIDSINQNKEKGDYLIGIDEILTGVYRTGKFLCSKGVIHEPDLIAISKATSDMTFPTSYVLASDKVYESAKKNNLVLVEELETKFINQLGSHITLNGLKMLNKDQIEVQVDKSFSYFKESLKDTVKKSKFHKEIVGKGLLIYIKLNKKVFPINFIGEHFAEFLMSSYFLTTGKVLFLNSRITPSISIGMNDLREVVKRIKITLPRIRSLSFSFLFIKHIFCIYYLIYRQKICEYLFLKKEVILALLKRFFS